MLYLINSPFAEKIKTIGNDRVKFLNNILSNDIKNIKSGGHSSAALLSAAGKVLAFMEVLVFDDFILLVVEKNQVEKTMELLNRYIITEDVELKNVSSEFPLPEIPMSEEAFEVSRIEAGQLRYGINMDDTVTLSETGLDDIAASETKGCYPGQEVVARTKTYQGLQKKMTGLVFNSELIPKAGDKIYSADGQKEIGRITSACFSPGFKKGIALGYLLKGFFDPGISVGIQTAGKTIKANTAKLPFTSLFQEGPRE